MTFDNFLSYLQQLLTMVDPEDRSSIELAKKALSATIRLAIESGKVDSITRRFMRRVESHFDQLVANADDFAGKPGEYLENARKRSRLEMALHSHC